jgi:hypothetical protein
MSPAENADWNDSYYNDIHSSGYYDSEFGDIVPEVVYDDGLYLGDGVWVTNDFFDKEEGQPSWLTEWQDFDEDC